MKVLISCFALTLLGLPAQGDPQEKSASRDREFETRMRPLLETYCASCHGPRKQSAKIELASAQGEADLGADRRSVLDSALEEAKRLQSSLGGSDRNKLDEYLTSVRDVEKRIEFASRRVPDAAAPAFNAGDLQEVEGRIPPEKGIPEVYADFDRLMIDLIALAFQTDTTRVAMLSHTGYRAYPEVGVKRGHHDLQHHEGDPEKREELGKIDRYNVGLYSYAVEKLGSVQDGESSLLDNAMLMYGSGMSNGNRHSRENLPILLAGRGGGSLKPGRYIDYNSKKMTPLSNLYVEMLNRMGIPTTKFGDSTGGLSQLA